MPIAIGLLPIILRYGTYFYGLWGAKTVYDDLTSEPEDTAETGGGISTKQLLVAAAIIGGGLMLYSSLKD